MPLWLKGHLFFVSLNVIRRGCGAGDFSMYAVFAIIYTIKQFPG